MQTTESGRGAQSGAQPAPASTGKTGANDSSSAVSDAGNAIPEKSLDTGSEEVDNASPVPQPEWVETALVKAGELQAAIPVDAPAPILPLFQALTAKLVEAGGGIEYAAVPDDSPPATFAPAKKKPVANRVAARPGWKASCIARFKPLMEAIPLAAGRGVFDALEELKKAVVAAQPGASAEAD